MCEGNKRTIGNHEKAGPNKITIFTAKWCGACKQRVPQILKKAQEAGFQVKLVDIDDAPPEEKKLLKHVRFVPHIDYMGHEIDEDELDRLCKNHNLWEAKK